MNNLRQIMVKRSLANLSEGEKGEIVQIRGNVVTQRYLLKMGLAVGREISIEKVERKPPDYSITVKAGDNTARLDESEATNILVKVPQVIEERKVLSPARSNAVLYYNYP